MALLIAEWNFAADNLSTVPQRERTEEVCAEVEGWHGEGGGEVVEYIRGIHKRILLRSSSLSVRPQILLCSAIRMKCFSTGFLETDRHQDPGVPRHHIA
jgi:hypothetical protein